MREMSDDEKLFAEYYNGGVQRVAAMTDADLREHHAKMRELTTKAKAELAATSDEVRKRESKKRASDKDKEWLKTVDTSQGTKNALNAVKQRKARMSQLDKIEEGLRKAGLSDDKIKEMLLNLSKTATEKNLKSSSDAISKVPEKIDDNILAVREVIDDTETETEPETEETESKPKDNWDW